jgi:hypothetical protein
MIKMERKILSTGIVSLFLLSSLISFSTAGMNATKADDEIVTVTIHAFYDVNENGIHDTDPMNNEGDAVDFFVWSRDEPIFIHDDSYKGKTDSQGYISFETKITDFFTVWVREKWDYDPSQWKSDTWFDVWDPLPVKDYYEVIEIPVIYVEKESESLSNNPVPNNDDRSLDKIFVIDEIWMRFDLDKIETFDYELLFTYKVPWYPHATWDVYRINELKGECTYVRLHDHISFKELYEVEDRHVRVTSGFFQGDIDEVHIPPDEHYFLITSESPRMIFGLHAFNFHVGLLE